MVLLLASNFGKRRDETLLFPASIDRISAACIPKARLLRIDMAQAGLS
jgi:hypothetical protein